MLPLLTRLRGWASTAEIPIVIVSADATPGQISRLRDAGANGYITKPLDVARLLRLLDAIAEISTQPHRVTPADPAQVDHRRR
ncbi:MAG TPA: hypothetical protein VHN80_25425 [Kineosporiaceae bacterium]|nr:hypothetical protein [Kineosporiaceae bacterium]